MPTVLVTGGAGAIGSNVNRLLLAQGFRVVVLDDLSSGHRELVSPKVEFIEGSVCDQRALTKAFSCNPDYVVHLAALFANQNSVDHPDLDLEVNGKGVLAVLTRALDQRVKKIVFTSSSCVYGNNENNREDVLDLRPETPYAITKLLGEQYCKFWASFHRQSVAVVRLFNSYGPGEFPGKYRNVIPNFVQLAIQGQPLPITGTGEETRDFTYVDDIVNGIVAAMLRELREVETLETFNLASGRPTRIIDLAETINRIAGNSAGVRLIPSRKWDSVLHRRGDIEKARSLLSYSPSTTLEDGLKNTFQWLKENA